MPMNCTRSDRPMRETLHRTCNFSKQIQAIANTANTHLSVRSGVTPGFRSVDRSKAPTLTVKPCPDHEISRGTLEKTPDINSSSGTKHLWKTNQLDSQPTLSRNETMLPFFAVSFAKSMLLARARKHFIFVKADLGVQCPRNRRNQEQL